MILRSDRRSTILLLALRSRPAARTERVDRATRTSRGPARRPRPPRPNPDARAGAAEPDRRGTAGAHTRTRAPPQPEAVAVEAGQRLGPIRIGMSRDELGALGLAEGELDEPDSQRFGPYRVFLDDDGVRRVEAEMGDLGRVRFGDRVFALGHRHPRDPRRLRRLRLVRGRRRALPLRRPDPLRAHHTHRSIPHATRSRSSAPDPHLRKFDATSGVQESARAFR